MYQIPELSWRIPASWFESLLYFIALTPKFLQLQVERQHCQTKKASLTDCWKRLRCQWTPRWIESSIGARRFLIVPRYLGRHSSNPNPLASLSVSFSCFPMFSSVVFHFVLFHFLHLTRILPMQMKEIFLILNSVYNMVLLQQ